MNNFLSKISPEILNVKMQNDKLQKLDCIIYANDFLKLKNKATNFLNKDELFEYPFINAFGAKLKFNEVVSFAKSNVVKYISKQSRVTALIDISKKIMGIEDFYKNGINGKNSTVVIIDTGINPHLDFCLPSKRIVKFVDFINGKTKPYDDNGHGTFVASIVGGNGIVSNGKYAGICKNCNIIGIKALESNGEAGAFKILEAMQWVYDNKQKYNIKVVCMSFGSNPLGNNDPMLLGAETLWNEGIVVIAAAGNSGPEYYTIKSPGTSNRIITVGGLNDNRNSEGQFDNNMFDIAEFSSRGPVGYYFKPDLIAPAVNIKGASYAGGYNLMSGTSVATPMIAGIALLILEKYPKISPDQVKIKILKSCKKIKGNPNQEGFGLFTLPSKFI